MDEMFKVYAPSKPNQYQGERVQVDTRESKLPVSKYNKAWVSASIARRLLILWRFSNVCGGRSRQLC